jgi:[ribosomal protein S5]-alanine N-acetyltransferase
MEGSQRETSPKFSLSRALIRSWRAGDEVSLARHANNREIWRNLRDTFPHPYTLADAQNYVSRHVKAGDVSNLAIEIHGSAVGGIGLRRMSDEDAEIGYWLSQDYWGLGVMTEAVQVITQFGLTELCYIAIRASVYEWNPASARVLEKAGYRLEMRNPRAVVKDGSVIDELIYVARQQLSGPT